VTLVERVEALLVALVVGRDRTGVANGWRGSVENKEVG
jgi:hypothetical protein